MKSVRILALVVAVSAGAISAEASSQLLYSGQLTSGNGGLSGAGAWSSGSALDWEVCWDAQAGLYTYTYTLTVAQGPKSGISHMTVETSDNFDDAFWMVGAEFNIDKTEWGSQGPHPAANPHLPETFTGLKVETDSDVHDAMFWITTDREPIVGDFYAKGGGGRNDPSSLFNTGFTNPDSDPVFTGLDSGQLFREAYGFHVLVPNHQAVPPQATVPEPLSAVAVTAAAGALATYLRRRRTI
jgi:hypothetical protein